MRPTELVMRAIGVATRAHGMQTRKELSEPYIVHPIAVAETAADLGANAELIAVCLLHDTVEDTDMTLATLSQLFPDSPFIVTTTDAVTKSWSKIAIQPSELARYKRDYYEKICHTPGAPFVKVLDRLWNLRDMIRTVHKSPNTNKWARTYLAKTLAEFGPVLDALEAQSVSGFMTKMGVSAPNVDKTIRLFHETVTELAQEIAK